MIKRNKLVAQIKSQFNKFGNMAFFFRTAVDNFGFARLYFFFHEKRVSIKKTHGCLQLQGN